MGLRPMVLVVIATAACARANPAFDQDGGDTGGDEDTGKDTKDDAVTSVDASTDNASVEGTGIASSNSGEATTMASDELGTTDPLESGGVACADLVDFDWWVDIIQAGDPAEVDCAVGFEVVGTVTLVEDGLLVINDCLDCSCATTRADYEFHAPGLIPADRFTVDDCASVSIEWSPDVDCRPIGFVARSGDVNGRVQVVAGQDVETLPASVGGAAIDVTRAQTCDCPECCPETGTLALGFAGTVIEQGDSADVDEFLENADTYFVRVHEAHAHEDCSRALSWSAILNL